MLIFFCTVFAVLLLFSFCCFIAQMYKMLLCVQYKNINNFICCHMVFSKQLLILKVKPCVKEG